MSSSLKQAKREDCTKSVSLWVWASPQLNFACHLGVLSIIPRYFHCLIHRPPLCSAPAPSLVLLCGILLTKVGVGHLLWAVIISQGMKCNSWGFVSQIQYDLFWIKLMDEEIQSVELPASKQPMKIRISGVWDV